ncbi:endonuclease Q family protein [Cytobacillus gottheilii]|uniref:endonuclease Q family protein n=1 Tax=Cytobacillus gottheilii TaxID=859144 RepID=UPI00249418AE|nr:endonuclease Q family protein [Cytobacillus gottheilii]
MRNYYADLHIHIGRTYTGKPVKITGSKSLTFSNIIDHARDEKGLNMIGIIDCHSPEVIQEMEMLIAAGEMAETKEGGLDYGDLTIIPGSEIEIYDENCKGPIHVLCYFPGIMEMKSFSHWLSQHLKNITLSSQRIYADGKVLQQKVKDLGGLFVPAHVFTPFKSLFGKGVHKSLTEVFDANLIDGIELGLSSNTQMADQIGELHRYSFLTNSDAHSLSKIAREYQTLYLQHPSFQELKKALHREEGRKIAANYGLDPLLGKYHETVCASCSTRWQNAQDTCSNCGHHAFVKGVAERILELKTAEAGKADRPPYIHQIPLEFVPGLGSKMLEKLLNHFGTEMNVLHHVSEEQLGQVIPEKIANLIAKARSGKLSLAAGGGGKYGKISE